MKESCCVAPERSVCGHCGVPGRSGAAGVVAFLPSKAPLEDLEALKVSVVVESPGQALHQVLCPCSEQEGSEVKMCYGTLTDNCYYLCSKDYIHEPVRSLYQCPWVLKTTLLT